MLTFEDTAHLRPARLNRNAWSGQSRRDDRGNVVRVATYRLDGVHYASVIEVKEGRESRYLAVWKVGDESGVLPRRYIVEGKAKSAVERVVFRKLG